MEIFLKITIIYHICHYNSVISIHGMFIEFSLKFIDLIIREKRSALNCTLICSFQEIRQSQSITNKQNSKLEEEEEEERWRAVLKTSVLEILMALTDASAR